MKSREEKTVRSGKKPGGKPPAPPSPGVRPTDQINLTDTDSRIMPATGKGFEQSYNAQAAVDTESMLVVAIDMAQVATDKQQLEPMLAVLAGLPETLSSVEHWLADNGYFSAANVAACVEAKIEPLLATRGIDRIGRVRVGHGKQWRDAGRVLRSSRHVAAIDRDNAFDRAGDDAGAQCDNFRKGSHSSQDARRSC